MGRKIHSIQKTAVKSNSNGHNSFNNGRKLFPMYKYYKKKFHLFTISPKGLRIKSCDLGIKSCEDKVFLKA
jgi:hypothetical protein